MLQRQDQTGQTVRLAAEGFAGMGDAGQALLAGTCLRPGPVNLHWHADGEGGYPYRHCELYPRDAAAETRHRHLLWTLYLNDSFEAGATESLFQQRRIVPRTGGVPIAPTTFTHRGNRPRGADKLIATRWILFQPASWLFGNR